MPMFEIVEHTADVSLRIETRSVEDLFIEAGRAFISLLVENPEAVAAREAVHIDIETDSLPTLLHDWLGELLFIYMTRGLVLVEFDIKIDEMRIKAIAYGELFNPIKHQRYREIKAITYEGLEVLQRACKWRGQVTIDV